MKANGARAQSDREGRGSHVGGVALFSSALCVTAFEWLGMGGVGLENLSGDGRLVVGWVDKGWVLGAFLSFSFTFPFLGRWVYAAEWSSLFLLVSPFLLL